MGLLVGSATAVCELGVTALVCVGLLLVLAWPRGRREVLRPALSPARTLTRFERGRLRALLGIDTSGDHSDERALRYLAARWPLGLLGALVLFVPLAATALWLTSVRPLSDLQRIDDVALSGLALLFLLFLCAQGAFGVASLEERLARRLLGPSNQERLERRIEELAASRAGVVEAVQDERRRIERDLHDGVQQRLVALGMLLGRARRSPDTERVAQLLAQAHEESRQVLTDLREVAWRVHPTVLDEAGLPAALETLTERSTLPVRLEYGCVGEVSRAVAAVAYFVVAEAVSNAIKHSGASSISVRVATAGHFLLLRVEDDGKGGADENGGGLLGLARRTAAVDGRLRVLSPVGGPTTITAELPCA